ncbi:MAG: hypothetical protein IJP08_03255, partial [Bacteroidaceae bacterium]|nr:hypothetical protein [Bacteroidaceae bacterium]
RQTDRPKGEWISQTVIAENNKGILKPTKISPTLCSGSLVRGRTNQPQAFVIEYESNSDREHIK